MQFEVFEHILLDVSYVGTAFGFLAATFGLWQNRKLKIKEYEESIEREYRELIKEMPYKLFINESLSHQEVLVLSEKCYRYFDFTNNQIELRNTKTIGNKTWHDWQEGILTNMNIKEISEIFRNIISVKPNLFTELQYLVKSKKDPKKWKKNEKKTVLNI